MTDLTSLAVRAHELLAQLPLAADPVPEPEDVRPGWITLLIVLLLIAASVFLWFSMRKQLGRIRVPRDGDDDRAGIHPDGADPERSDADNNDRPSGPPLS